MGSASIYFMKCLIINKLIPFCIEETDSFFHKMVTKHCKHCEKCNQTYSQYKSTEKILHSCKEHTIPKNITDNYWNELYAKINELPQENTKKINIFSMLWQPMLGIAMLFLVIGIGYHLYNYNYNNDIIQNKDFINLVQAEDDDLYLQFWSHDGDALSVTLPMLNFQEPIDCQLEEVDLNPTSYLSF